MFGERLLNCYETGRSWPHRQRSMRLKRANLGWSNVVTFFPLSIIAMKFRLKVRIGTENNVISLISNPHIKWDFSIFSSVVSLCSSLMAQNMCTSSNMKGNALQSKCEHLRRRDRASSQIFLRRYRWIIGIKKMGILNFPSLYTNFLERRNRGDVCLTWDILDFVFSCLEFSWDKWESWIFPVSWGYFSSRLISDE